jgi:nucleoside-diphosphate-sugar epimerase
MDVDVLLTGVTGFVGRFILLELIENYPQTKIGVIIRPAKDKTPAQRFQDEIINDTMFSKYHTILSKVNVIGASIEDIEKTSLFVKSVNCIIHCAANVKHYDPYNMLLKDNVHNMQIILKLSEQLHCKKLVLLSTCYVHPKVDTLGEVVRIPNTPRDAFYNDYCYTKWLGEEEVFKAESTIKEINIVRLSCVGAPLRKDLQSHPFSAQAHLGILSLASRGYLTTIGLTPDARLSVIPVDLVSKYIVSVYLSPNKKEITEPILHQVCPPKHLDVFHPNFVNIFSIAQYELGINSLRTVLHDGNSSNYLPSWYSILRFFNKKVDRFVDLHDKVQDFVLLFTQNDIRFDSSLPLEYFPSITEKDFLLDTYNFCIRTSHHLQFKKGVPMSLTDKFWHKMAKKEPIQLCCTLFKPFQLSEIETLKTRIWSLYCSNRKFCTVVENDKWVYKPGSFESHFSTFEFDEKDALDESLVISKGLNKPIIENIWHCDLVIHNNTITHALLQWDHGITDGVGFIKPIVNKIDNYILDKPVQKFIAPPSRKKLNFFQDLIFTLSFIAIVLVAFLFNDTYTCNRTSNASISTNTIPLIKDPTRTYTTTLLWKLTKSLATHTRQENFIFCIPSVISVDRAADKIINNNFVGMLLPVSSTMTEEQFNSRCSLLKSKCAIFLMYCLQELITMREWWWLRDKIMSKVSAIVSSVNLGKNMPSLFSSVHVATTTPNPIPFCITALSDITNSFITVRSHDSLVPASKILQDIC